MELRWRELAITMAWLIAIGLVWGLAAAKIGLPEEAASIIGLFIGAATAIVRLVKTDHFW